VLRVAANVIDPALLAGLRPFNAGSLRILGGTLSRTSFDITGDRIELPAFSATLISH
jgi:hypothetical protein